MPGEMFAGNLLTKVMEHYPHCYELRDTAGVHQIYRGKQLPKPLDVLRTHYGEGGAWAA